MALLIYSMVRDDRTEIERGLRGTKKRKRKKRFRDSFLITASLFLHASSYLSTGNMGIDEVNLLGSFVGAKRSIARLAWNSAGVHQSKNTVDK